jgi:signal transduction histidine kinase
MNDKEYSIKVGINSLKHLGVGLYSSVPAIISEAVANAWDADAKNVHIAIHQGKGEIVIQDDGCGMDVDDCNAKYLTVGYERRESGLSIR